MKFSLYKKGVVIGITILFFASSLAIGVPSPSSKTVNEGQPSELVSDSEFVISIEQTQEMIGGGTALLLDVQEHYTYNNINGVLPVLLSDLECESCLDVKFRDTKNLIVYSENSEFRMQAADILRGREYIVYELVDSLPSKGFPIAYQVYNPDIEVFNDEYSSVQISGSDAQVGVYSRGGQIKRLYGEAFSSGDTPEDSAEAFLQSNAQLFGIEPTDMGDQYVQPIMYLSEIDDYKFTGVNYVQYKDGVRVFRSRLILLVKNEEGYPLVHASVDIRDLGDFSPETTQGNLNPEGGINNAWEMSSSMVHFTQPELVIWAGIDDMVVQPTLAYSFVGDNDYENSGDTPEKYLFVTDAVTGDIVYVENLIYFTDVTGNVQGKVTQGKAADFCEAELAEDFMWARVNIGGIFAYADANGDFTISNSGSSPVTVESPLWGQWFKVTNQAGANTIVYESVTPPGPADFMHNDLNTDEFKRAEANGYYQANIVRDFTLMYNPSYPGLQQNGFPVKVNDNTGYCPGNAWYDGSSITFCRAGSGYPNTAWSTIIHHEYGHHLVALAGSGQGQYGEGMGDVMGVLILDEPGTGWGFFGDCNQPLRHAVNDIQYPCSGEIHFCGQLISGCVWETRNELVITNPSTYSDIINNLAINAMLVHTGDMITPSITIDYLTLDDDNGNIYDGTPHYWEIAAGFGEHSMNAPPLSLLAFEFPDGIPEIVSPDGGTVLRVNVSGVAGTPEPDTGIMHIDSGSGWYDLPMDEVEPNVYDAVFPSGPCTDKVSFYFSAETTDGGLQLWPPGAPNEWYNAVFAYSVDIFFEDDFENDLGWSVENDPYLTSGAWERGVPAGGGGRGDPPTDYDGSGQCYLTENAYGDTDVDGGITWLISPSIDLSDTDDAQVDYALWYTNHYGADPHNDLFKVYVSNDDGANWVLADTIGPVTTSGWKEKSFMVGDFATTTNQMKVRFEASDLNDGSVVEAGIDAFSISVFDCDPPLESDLTCDGDLSWASIAPGSTVSAVITIENIGEPGSYLDWEICECPTWGIWTFTPQSGDDLTPEEGAVTVDVEVVVPNQQNQDFSGEVKVMNRENGTDFDILPVTLSTPRISVFNATFLWILQQFPNAFPILRQLVGL